jgi:hypothetical protein
MKVLNPGILDKFSTPQMNRITLRLQTAKDSCAFKNIKIGQAPALGRSYAARGIRKTRFLGRID